MITKSKPKKPRKKRECADYYVVVGEDLSVGCFKTHRSAVKFIKEQLDTDKYGLKETDLIRVVKTVHKEISSHPVQFINIVKAANLDLI